MKQSYCPIGVNKDGERMAPPPAKLSAQEQRGMYETPQMRRPTPYSRPGTKTYS